MKIKIDMLHIPHGCGDLTRLMARKPVVEVVVVVLTATAAAAAVAVEVVVVALAVVAVAAAAAAATAAAAVVAVVVAAAAVVDQSNKCSGVATVSLVHNKCSVVKFCFCFVLSTRYSVFNKNPNA